MDPNFISLPNSSNKVPMVCSKDTSTSHPTWHPHLLSHVTLHGTLTCYHISMCMVSSPANNSVIPPYLGVTRGDYVSRPTMENMIYAMMMMINMSAGGSPTTPLIFLPTQINQGSSHSSNPEYGRW
jgi:hypothetical protein